MAAHEQKTEPPSPRKRQKARREGRFPVSREFVSAVQFVLTVQIALAFAPQWWDALAHAVRDLLRAAFEDPLTPAATLALARGLTDRIGRPAGLWALAVSAGVLTAHLASTRLGWAPGKLAPDLKRLNPAARLAQLPRQNLAQVATAALLVLLFTVTLWWLWIQTASWSQWAPRAGLGTGVRLAAETARDLLTKACAVLLLLGLVDLARQHRRFSSEMRMSRQELREEMKESEGNPQMKARIRRLMRDLSRRRMMDEVARATAVVVNPTHYAVAIRYRPAEAAAPKVVAKGKNYLAGRIRQRAIHHQIPIVENPPLAQALYRSAQVGQEIPAHLYRAVAEVLAYIYRLLDGRLPGAA